MPESATSRFISASDGLRLHARCYGRGSLPVLPVICLPGLARTAADFEKLAVALSGHADHPRRVIALDYRGRGQSAYDRDPANYALHTELADMLSVATALDTLPAVIIGTSRGGILAMLLATLRPTAIAGVVLNDIGPVIEPKGLMRIKGYIGKLPEPRSFDEGAEILRHLFDAQFPKLTDEDWKTASLRTFKEENGRLLPTYDVRLARTLEGINFERPLPPLWKEFDALAHVPLMVVRGANSDLLSPQTIDAMRARRSEMDLIEVPDQGHTPLLVEDDIIARIAAFAADCDRRHAIESMAGAEPSPPAAR